MAALTKATVPGFEALSVATGTDHSLVTSSNSQVCTAADGMASSSRFLRSAGVSASQEVLLRWAAKIKHSKATFPQASREASRRRLDHRVPGRSNRFWSVVLLHRRGQRGERVTRILQQEKHSARRSPLSYGIDGGGRLF